MESRCQEEASKVDSIFQRIENMLSKQREEEEKRLGKRKLFIGIQKFVSVYTPEWRKAVICFSENIPMSHLIQGFYRYYQIPTGPSFEEICLRLSRKRLRRGTTSKDSKAVVQRVNKEDGESIFLPSDVLEKIFSRLRLADMATSRLVYDDWATVYNSKHFQSKYNRTEACIVINNHNLDMWGFSLISKSWFPIKVPCDWENLGMKTLGIKASCDGLFLVARSDLTLYVVNPLTAQCKRLPNIYPHNCNHIELLSCLIVHGTAQMERETNTGHFRVYLFGNCQDFLCLARYNSKTQVWTVKKISLFEDDEVILSETFPSPLWSYRRGNVIVCLSATCRYLEYFCNDAVNNDDNIPYVRVRRVSTLHIPTTIDSKCSGEKCYSNVSLPTVVPYMSGPLDYGLILVGRVKGERDYIYGRLPIVPHVDIDLWKFNQVVRTWTMIHTISVTDNIINMIKSSEGTDFVVVGDGNEDIWFLLRGSDSMLHYKLSTKEWVMESGCPGGGYMDANFHWKAVFESLRFDVQV